MNKNLNNLSSSFDNNNTNLKTQYNNLKQKIDNLEKNNLEMIEIYKAEEERLLKSNGFLMTKKNQENSRTIQELESEVLKMRDNIQLLQKIKDKKNYTNPDLIENEDKIIDNNYVLNNSEEKKAKEEYLINYRNKLMIEFEKKLIDKHKELVNYYIEQNDKIKKNKGKEEDIFNVDEIKFFSIKGKTSQKSENSKDKKDNKKNNNLEELIKNINENDNEEVKEINLEKVNKILSLLCLKEEYPKQFFIDYILDETYSGNAYNQEESFSKLLEMTKEAGNKPKNEIQQFIQKKPRRKSFFHKVFCFSINKILDKICKLFDIKYEKDVEIIKNYLNKIMELDNNNIRHYFEKNLVKYRFAPYEPNEIENYDKKIKKLFEKDILKIQNILKFEDNIITLDLFEEFIKKYFYTNDITDDLIYYIMYIMKLTKKQKKEEKSKNIKSLGLFEFYLLPFFHKVND